MISKPTKIVGLSVKEFDKLRIDRKEFILQPARLIPFYKPGDEMALTSIFLSALRLVNEFQYQIFQTISLSRSKHILIFTEAEFLLFENKRIDGLILVVRPNNIIDAVPKPDVWIWNAVFVNSAQCAGIDHRIESGIE